MFRRLIFFALLLALGSAASIRWGNLPGGIRFVESLFKPVFHKEIINRYAGIYKEDPLFVTSLIKVESNFLRTAKSPRGAIGLMQIMPATAQEIARELKIRNFKESDLESPEVNIHFGFHYLAKLRKEFGDHDITVLAAYNAGRKNVKSWLKEKKKKMLGLEDIEFVETQNFAHDVLSTYNWLKKFQKWRNKILTERRQQP